MGILGLGLGLLTGGLAGVGTAALAGSKSPAGKAFGMYQTGKNVSDSFSKPPDVSQPANSDSQVGNDYSMQDDMMGAMKRRKNMLGVTF